MALSLMKMGALSIKRMIILTVYHQKKKLALKYFSDWDKTIDNQKLNYKVRIKQGFDRE